MSLVEEKDGVSTHPLNVVFEVKTDGKNQSFKVKYVSMPNKKDLTGLTLGEKSFRFQDFADQEKKQIELSPHVDAVKSIKSIKLNVVVSFKESNDNKRSESSGKKYVKN